MNNSLYLDFINGMIIVPDNLKRGKDSCRMFIRDKMLEVVNQKNVKFQKEHLEKIEDKMLDFMIECGIIS